MTARERGMTREELAHELANELRELAIEVERAGQGSEVGIRNVARNRDGYWHQLVVGGAEKLSKILGEDGEG